MKNNSQIKHELANLRKVIGRGYAPKAVKILHDEHKRTVDPQDVYHVAHGRLKDDTILQVLCKIAIAKKSNDESTLSMLKEAIA